MNCKQVNKFIVRHFDEEVPSAVQAHLDQCRYCRELYAQQTLIKDLLSLRRYEEPKSGRIERGVANIMRQVRLSEDRYDQRQSRFIWLFTEPRYGVALLFLVFIGLNLVKSDPAQYAGGVFHEDSALGHIMARSESPQLTMTNDYNYPEFNIEQMPAMLPDLGAPVKLVNFAEDK